MRACRHLLQARPGQTRLRASSSVRALLICEEEVRLRLRLRGGQCVAVGQAGACLAAIERGHVMYGVLIIAIIAAIMGMHAGMASSTDSIRCSALLQTRLHVYAHVHTPRMQPSLRASLRTPPSPPRCTHDVREMLVAEVHAFLWGGRLLQRPHVVCA